MSTTKFFYPQYGIFEDIDRENNTQLAFNNNEVRTTQLKLVEPRQVRKRVTYQNKQTGQLETDLFYASLYDVTVTFTDGSTWEEQCLVISNFETSANSPLYRFLNDVSGSFQIITDIQDVD